MEAMEEGVANFHHCVINGSVEEESFLGGGDVVAGESAELVRPVFVDEAIDGVGDGDWAKAVRSN